MLSSLSALKRLSLPCPVGTKPTSLWQKSSRSACQRILPLLAAKPMIAPPSDRQRPPGVLKPAFLVALTALRLYQSPQVSIGVVIEWKTSSKESSVTGESPLALTNSPKLSWASSALPTRSHFASHKGFTNTPLRIPTQGIALSAY